MALEISCDTFKCSWKNYDILVCSTTELRFALPPAESYWELFVDDENKIENPMAYMRGTYLSGKNIALLGQIKLKDHSENVEIYIETRLFRKYEVVAKIAGKSITLKKQR